MHAFLLLLSAATLAQVPAPRAHERDTARWAREARAVTITRDDWGIPHVRGKTDADAVFGMIYAQAEDDFNRVETNYLLSTGRLAEAEGERAIWQDLRMKLFIDPDSMRAKYAASPAWLKRLMDAWADGLNYYLFTHPKVKPRVITRFEPWMALTFSEGSIGGDIESVDLGELQAFYGDSAARPAPAVSPPRTGDGAKEPSGSNGFAIAPANTVNGRALFLINPHTSFFFRAELQMTSEEGLNAYGAATWGQFFLYQGFNERLGWMHTSTGADVIDEYAESVVQKGGRLFYRYGGEERRIVTGRITVPYRTATGMARRTFTVYRTHHGPIVREAGGKWISVRLMEKPIEALSQSFLRTKARTLAEYRKVMELHANSSNNTVYADADGHIAYFHPQFIPKRDDRFDWTRPWTAAIRRPNGTACTRSRTARTSSIRQADGSRTPTTGRTRRPERTAPSGKAFPGTWTPSAKARGGCTRSGCWRTEGLHARSAAGCGVRQLSHGVRAARAGTAGGVRLDLGR